MKINKYHLSVAIILFLGGAACIVWSVNIKDYKLIVYNVNTTGTIISFAPLNFSFIYSYFDQEDQYKGMWLVSKPNVPSGAVIELAYAKEYPECSILLEIPGSQLYDSCGPIIGNKWFWPILMTCGILTMTVGGVFGFHMICFS